MLHNYIVKNTVTSKKNKFNLLYAIFLLTSLNVFSNNLIIANAAITNTNATEDYSQIQFDISWENSWRDSENWDAAWVFIKYQISGSNIWNHATLSTSGHTAPSGSTIDTSTDNTGVFIYRNTNGSGTFSLNNIQLRWNYGANSVADGETINIQIFAIEMVYVPQGSFYVGDGEINNIYGNFEAGTTGTPFQITSEASITLGGGTAGSLGNNNEEGMDSSSGADDFGDSISQTLPANFPKGYNAFYSMKYELSQAAFVAFLNNITTEQASWVLNRVNISIFSGLEGQFGGTASELRYQFIGTHPNINTDNPYIPMIFLNWSAAAPFADWAGLRPMTELEFEKACRGPVFPISSEYPWGTAGINLSENLTLSNFGAANEGIASGYTVDPTEGNCWVEANSQTMIYLSRIGIFAADPNNTGRVTSGATYWGIMDMGGNAWERCVSVGRASQRTYTGIHGDGQLRTLSSTIPDADEGLADVVNWPSNFGNGVAYFEMGYRGGGLAFPSPNIHHNARISSRRLATAPYEVTIQDDGIRFVRTAP